MQGPSGRVVIEIPPEQKVEFYGYLKRNGLNFRQWLLTQMTIAMALEKKDDPRRNRRRLSN